MFCLQSIYCKALCRHVSSANTSLGRTFIALQMAVACLGFNE